MKNWKKDKKSLIFVFLNEITELIICTKIDKEVQNRSIINSNTVY